MNSVKIALIGLGTVGGGTFNLLQKNQQSITNRLGRPIEITHIGARRENPQINTKAYQVSSDIFDALRDPEVDIVVELIGGTTTALEVVTSAIKLGKHVVTANKALIALHGETIFRLAKEHKVNVAFEAAVAGGIPIIKASREGMAANNIECVMGIINGTANYILSEMHEKGRAFSDVLKEAQDKGYAEADPTFDIEGIDAAHKLSILAAIAFGVPLNFSKVYTEGISFITPEDLKYAEELGYRIKHLGIAKKCETGIELRVHPTLIEDDCLLANVNGVMNAVLLQADAVGSTLYYGAGAGALPTASAVVADIIDVARKINVDEYTLPFLAFNALDDAARFIEIDEIETAYYLHLNLSSKPGVLARIAKIFASFDISIEAIVQKEDHEDDQRVPVIILTQKVSEKKINQALEEIVSNDDVSNKAIKIRIEHETA